MFEWNLEHILIFCSLISATCSAVVGLTCCLFPRFGRKIFLKLIFYISVCDMLGCIGAALGYPLQGTQMCTFQAIWLWFWYRSSWGWTVALTHQLYCVIVMKKAPSLLKLHVVVWGFALLQTILPILCGYSFGVDNFLSGNGWCSTRAPTRLLIVWDYLTIFGLVLICFLAMIWFFVLAYWKYYDESLLNDVDGRQNAIKCAIRQLIYYPMAMIVTWFPIEVFFPLVTCNLIPVGFIGIGNIMATQYGSMIALVFFIRSAEARQHWLSLFNQLPFSTTNTRSSSKHPTAPKASSQLTVSQHSSNSQARISNFKQFGNLEASATQPIAYNASVAPSSFPAGDPSPSNNRSLLLGSVTDDNFFDFENVIDYCRDSNNWTPTENVL